MNKNSFKFGDMNTTSERVTHAKTDRGTCLGVSAEIAAGLERNFCVRRIGSQPFCNALWPIFCPRTWFTWPIWLVPHGVSKKYPGGRKHAEDTKDGGEVALSFHVINNSEAAQQDIYTHTVAS
jgi:hypothetical protein